MRYEEEVARGIVVLDKARPGWRDRVNQGGLLMGDPSLCIVGQVFAGEGLEEDELTWGSSYDYGIHELRNMSGENPVQTETNFAISHGFDTYWSFDTEDNDVKTDLEDLRDAWIAALTELDALDEDHRLIRKYNDDEEN